ncbi:MAG: Holliday junction resolvase RuvX [Dehalococcoidia bacterium]|nr:Holliday junction resolvase RuvX [Dehalococcoidia bacterium]
MALDLGERRIGLAVSDAAETLAFPVGHLVRSNLKPDVERVLAIARDREVEGFVVGIPFSLSGEMGPGARRARGFARSLRKNTGLPVYTVDERFTSVEAEGLLREAGRQPSREKGSVDEAAAALILERFLKLRRE